MNDIEYMTLALAEARLAEDEGEVPVGAVVALDGKVIARAHNQVIALNDPTAHAEVLALRGAGQLLRNYRLPGATLYVTLEPCLMCFTAMIHARIGRLVFAAKDPKTGVCGSQLEAQDFPLFNHQFKIEGGLMADECGQVLSQFFKARRGKI